MRVGFIGVGNIGRPMAEQLVRAGYPMVVHDAREGATAPLVELGARAAGSVGEVAEECDVVCTCLPGPVEMEEVVLGDGGVAEHIKTGGIYIDHTTNSPAVVRRVSEVLSEKGVSMLDAPVSGGKEGAQTRDLTILVGGDVETLETSRPVLDAMAKTVLHVGGVGAGCVCKLMHNCVGFSMELAIAECMSAGVRAGVDPSVLIEVFQKCALGRGFQLQRRLPETVFSGDFEARFALRVAYKDMGLAREVGRENGVPMSLTDVTEREMGEAMSRGWGDRDSSIFMTLQEERAGVELRLRPSGTRGWKQSR